MSMSAQEHETRKKPSKKRVIIGCTGSVASIKVPLIVEELKELNYEVKVVATDHACHFFNAHSLPVKVHRDQEEWETWQQRHDPVLHIELRRWADLLVIAPLDANTLAKIAGGLCDNLLTCVVRAWDVQKPLYFAPAMNTLMWSHPITSRHMDSLKQFGYREIPCVEKLLECKDKGFGAMAEVGTIVSTIREALEGSVPSVT